MLLNNYISGQILIWTVIGALVLIGLVWLSQTLKLIEFLVNRGAGIGDFILISVLPIPLWLVVVLPAATLFATIMVLNTLQQDREITALSSVGMSNLAIVRGPLLIGAAVTAFLYLKSAFLLPQTYSGYKTMVSNLRAAVPIVVLQERVFTDMTKGLTVFITERDGRYSFKQIFVSDRRDPGTFVEIVAEGGFLDLQNVNPQLVFNNGVRSELVAGESQATLLNFDRYTMSITGELRESGPRDWDYNEFSIPRLLRGEHDHDKYSREMKAEGHFRLASPLLGLAMAVIGAAVILHRHYTRMSSWRMIVAGVVLAVAVEVALIVARGATIGQTSLYPLMYASAVVPIFLGLWSLRQPAQTRTDPGSALDAGKGV